MVFPVGTDESEHHTAPIITYFLILVNVGVFLVEQSQGEAFVRHWAFTPREFFANPIGHLPTVLTSMFLHGGWLHLIGNMAYLWTFGDNVEDNFGHLRFFVFYIIAGIFAMFAQAAYIPNSTLPNLGASIKGSGHAFRRAVCGDIIPALCSLGNKAHGHSCLVREID